MASEIINPKIQTTFENLESQNSILSNCTNLFKTLTSHYTSLHQLLSSKIETLDSKIETLDSDFSKSIEQLQHREDSIPDRLSSLYSNVESQKKSAIEEFQKPIMNEEASFSDTLKSMCRKMDESGLLKLAVSRRRESLTMRADMVNALSECVDPPRLVLNAIKEFVEMKMEGKSGLTDKRWACAMVVGGLFPPEKKGCVFSRGTIELAEEVVREWREVAEKMAAAAGGEGSGEGSSGMGPAEASMFLQIVIGFGLKERFDEEFLRKLVIEFGARRDMPKHAIALFGDQIGDIIDELVKNGKEVEAVYFAAESGLTKRFQPVPLLKSFLQNSKNKATEIQKKGNHTNAAQDEANTYEMNSIKFVIKCVEDHKIESEFPLESLRKRLAALERAKAERKKGSTGGLKSSHKRAFGSGPARGSGPPPPRSAKMTKFSGPYPSFGHRNPVPPAQQHPRYPALSSYPSYDAGLTSSSYGPNYGGSHIPPPAPITQHYGISGDGVSGVGGQLGGAYGGQIGYGSYDYGAAAPPSYKPPSYAQ